MLGRPGAQIRRHARYQVTSALPQKTSDHSKTEFKTMKLATLKDSTRDGRLVVVSRDLTRCSEVGHIARTLQAALDDWEQLRRVWLRSQKDWKPERNHPCGFMNTRPPRRCRAPISGPTVRPMSITSNWSARPATPRCRRRSGPIR